MNVLVLNCGSSSIKFQIVETDLDLIEKDSDRRLARGVIERVGSLALISFQAEGGQKLIEDATKMASEAEGARKASGESTDLLKSLPEPSADAQAIPEVHGGADIDSRGSGAMFACHTPGSYVGRDECRTWRRNCETVTGDPHRAGSRRACRSKYRTLYWSRRDPAIGNRS